LSYASLETNPPNIPEPEPLASDPRDPHRAHPDTRIVSNFQY